MDDSQRVNVITIIILTWFLQAILNMTKNWILYFSEIRIFFRQDS